VFTCSRATGAYTRPRWGRTTVTDVGARAVPEGVGLRAALARRSLPHVPASGLERHVRAARTVEQLSTAAAGVDP
jgi:hypothetical protein